MTHHHLNLQLPSSPLPQAGSSKQAAPVEPQPTANSTESPEELGQGTAQARATATRQSARIASVGAETDDASTPQSNAPRVTPLPGAPARSAAKPATKPPAKPATKQPAKQSAPKQPAPVDAPPAPSPRVPPATVPMQQTADVAALLARIAQLEQEQAERTAQPAEPSPRVTTPTLFASPEEVERARAAIITAKKDEPKVSLPDVVPGYKANPLDTGENRPLVYSQFEASHRTHHGAATSALGLTHSTQGAWMQLRTQTHSA